jgi:hypothetical protein
MGWLADVESFFSLMLINNIHSFFGKKTIPRNEPQKQIAVFQY